MPRFYFHVFDEVVALDVEGVDLPDLAAAQKVALDGARELICDQVRKGHLNLGHRVEVTDERGETVLKIAFRDVFTIEG